MALTERDVATILQAHAADRIRRAKQDDYYRGKHAIVANPGTNKDGTLRVAKVHNLIKKCVNRHVGFAFGQPVQYVSKLTDEQQARQRGKAPGLLRRAASAVRGLLPGREKPAPGEPDGPKGPALIVSEGEARIGELGLEPSARNDGLTALEEIREWNDLDAADMAHYKDTLIEEASFEVFSFDKPLNTGEIEKKSDIKIEITKMPRGECVGVFDTDGELRILVRKILVKAGTLYRGQIVPKDRTECWVYDDDAITVYDEVVTAAAGSGDPTYNYTMQDEVVDGVPNPELNRFGSILAVAFRIDRQMEPYISERAIELQDHFNNLFSSEGNSVIEDSKDHWHVSGFSNTEDNQKTFEEMIKKNVFFTPPDCTVTRIKTGVDVEMVADNRQWTRKALFETLGATDTEQITGATGEASGIALRLAHGPMIETAVPFIDMFQVGLRRRVDLINKIHTALGRPIVENYKIVMKSQVLVNEGELWDKLPTLMTGLALEDAISLAVPSIDDPKAAAARKHEERDKELERQIMLRDSPAPVGAPLPAQLADRVRQKAEAQAGAEPAVARRAANLISDAQQQDVANLIKTGEKLGIGQG